MGSEAGARAMELCARARLAIDRSRELGARTATRQAEMAEQQGDASGIERGRR